MLIHAKMHSKQINSCYTRHKTWRIWQKHSNKQVKPPLLLLCTYLHFHGGHCVFYILGWPYQQAKMGMFWIYFETHVHLQCLSLYFGLFPALTYTIEQQWVALQRFQDIFVELLWFLALAEKILQDYYCWGNEIKWILQKYFNQWPFFSPQSCGLSLCLILPLQNYSHLVVLVLTTCEKMSASAGFAIFSVFSSELLPTSLRSSAFENIKTIARWISPLFIL